MPNARMLFVVPENSAKLAEILSEHGGYLEYEQSLDDFTDYLSERVGQGLVAEFEDLDDPSDALYQFGQELEAQKAAYFGVSESYEERSRRDRYEGYVVYNVSGDSAGMVQKNFPWREGEPSLDDRSLRVAGVSDEDIDRINAVFFPSPEHRPA
ncbi:hypothetical protein D3C71_257230 [compost metagenome]